MAPQTQKALVIPEAKQPWKLRADWPVHTPGPDEVLVKNVSIALNPADWKAQAYAPPFIREYPFLGGLDGAGIVEAVGADVTNVAKGDKMRVLLPAFLVLFPGDFDQRNATFQQYSIVVAAHTAKIPDNLTFDQAASVPLGLATVLTGLWAHHPSASSVDFPALWEEGGTTKYAGQPALIIGGASSVGQYAIQVAKLQGFSPILTTASPGKHAALLRSLGATHILDRALPPAALLAEIVQATGGAPLPYAYDAIANEETQNLAYDALAPGGALVGTAPRAAPILQSKVDRDAGAGAKKIARPFASYGQPGNKALGEEVYKRLTGWLRDGVIVPNRVEVVPGGLNGIVEGCERIRGNKAGGIKLIVHPQETA
ncbi:GroES-like protein [Daedaleopsis nitida]|nr:GroES-like protein [Daedaleopsis nitida]